MKLTEKQIEEIADDLESGMKCYYNLKSGIIKVIPDFEGGFDDENWEEETKELDENESDYFEFENVNSHDSFSIMVDFAESVADVSLQDKLMKTLNRSRPFRNFKWEIDNSGAYRQKWFSFKTKRYIEWVKKQIEIFNLGINE